MPDLNAYSTWSSRGLSTIDRFMQYVFRIPESTCWYWSRHHDRDGYAKFHLIDRPAMAHRVSYELHTGPIPQGLELDHLCRQRGCVNPDHLEAVSSRENTLRSPVAPAAVNHKKTHCLNGHPLVEGNFVTSPSVGRYRICLTCTRVKDASRQRRYRHEKKMQREGGCKNS